MSNQCHRCHGELSHTATGSSDDEAMLFCPRCGAPQLVFPEHMHEQVEAPAVQATVSSTGALPPPRPAQTVGSVDWQAALGATALVAAIAAVLLVLSLRIPAVSYFSSIWTIGGAVVALGLYAKSRPKAWMDSRVGLRVGTVTGLLMIAAMGVALAATGAAMRATHSMAGFDAEMGRDFEIIHGQMVARIADQSPPPEVVKAQQKVMAIVLSPEGHAGVALFELGIFAMFVLIVSACGGAFAGLLRASTQPRPGLRRGD